MYHGIDYMEGYPNDTRPGVLPPCPPTSDLGTCPLSLDIRHGDLPIPLLDTRPGDLTPSPALVLTYLAVTTETCTVGNMRYPNILSDNLHVPFTDFMYFRIFAMSTLKRPFYIDY